MTTSEVQELRGVPKINRAAIEAIKTLHGWPFAGVLATLKKCTPKTMPRRNSGILQMGNGMGGLASQNPSPFKGVCAKTETASSVKPLNRNAVSLRCENHGNINGKQR